MPAVLDASVTLPWFLQDERTAFTDSVFAALGRDEFWVPAVWRLEFPNALLAAERKRRIDRQTRIEALEFASGLALRVDPAPIDMRSISAIAERHGLSTYDAAYLELAARQGIGLITLDRALADAAAAAGIAVQSPGRSTAAQTRRRYAAQAA
ncbi:MAG TPA: type II toxin-antitoxin system VapC family toxin [Burkholderiales bacterium]|jgi:predicted nucleic acid-binding protein